MPLSFVNIIFTAVVLFYGWPLWSLTILSLLVLGGTVWIIVNNPGTRLERNTVTVYSAGSLRTPRSSTPVEAGQAASD